MLISIDEIEPGLGRAARVIREHTHRVHSRGECGGVHEIDDGLTANPLVTTQIDLDGFQTADRLSVSPSHLPANRHLGSDGVLADMTGPRQDLDGLSTPRPSSEQWFEAPDRTGCRIVLIEVAPVRRAIKLLTNNKKALALKTLELECPEIPEVPPLELVED